MAKEKGEETWEEVSCEKCESKEVNCEFDHYGLIEHFRCRKCGGKHQRHWKPKSLEEFNNRGKIFKEKKGE